MIALTGRLRLHRILRHWRRLWAAALCAASFATGHLLFGDDDPPATVEAPSLLGQYRQATSQMVEESAASREPEVASRKPEVRPPTSNLRSLMNQQPGARGQESPVELHRLPTAKS